MRIFKNRGDVYFSKSNKEKSREQRFLFTGLIAIVAFTIVFVIGLGIKYDFSAKEFFAPEKEITTQSYTEESGLDFPEVSGKTNFLLCVNKDGELLFSAIVQADLDNISYKATLIKPETECDGERINEIYKRAGVESVESTLELLFATGIDYYIDINQKDFEDIYNDMTEVNYPILNDIRYKSDDEEPSYSIRIKSGEQKISGGDYVNLIRYYLHNDMCSYAGDLFLSSLRQHINYEFLENKDSLFTEMVTNSKTNLTVKDFSLADGAFEVLTNEKVGVGVYNAFAEYDGSELTNITSIKGYYSK